MPQVNENGDEGVDYTEIRDDAIRGKICKLMSDEHGIYPTSKFMWKMETYCMGLRDGEVHD